MVVRAPESAKAGTGVLAVAAPRTLLGWFLGCRPAIVVFPERIERRSRTMRWRQRAAAVRFRFVLSWFFHGWYSVRVAPQLGR